jgi:hypothetical protein
MKEGYAINKILSCPLTIDTDFNIDAGFSAGS